MPPPAFGVVGIDSWAGESFFGTLDLVFRASKSVETLFFLGPLDVHKLNPPRPYIRMVLP